MKRDVHEEMEKALSKNHAGYVLITCRKPDADGDMQIKMTYGGDAALASCLINGAQNYLDENEENEEAPETNLRLVK